MKTILTLLLLFTFQISLPAQGLSFNQVLVLKGTCPTGTHVIDTVPANRVWKVENIASLNVNIQSHVSGSIWATWGEDNDYYPFPLPASSASATVSQPIWLSEGEIIRAICGTSSSYYYYISIIEFSTGP